MNYYENKIRKNLNPKDFLQNAKEEFPGQSLESFSREYSNMENIILGFQFEPVCAKQACPNYSVGFPLRIQHDRFSTQEWCNCEKCEKMPTSLECVCCIEIPAFKAFHLNLKARLSWNTAVLELFAVEFNCDVNYFFEEFSQKFLRNHFLVLVWCFKNDSFSCILLLFWESYKIFEAAFLENTSWQLSLYIIWFRVSPKRK